MLATLNPNNHGAVLVFAKVQEQVRGYGHVKARHLAAARTQWGLLVQRFHHTQAQAA